MKYQFDGYNWIGRLDMGEELVEELTNFAMENKVSSCLIFAIGASEFVELGFYDLPKKQYIWKKFNKPLEIAALKGSIAWIEGKPRIHLHGTFSDEQMAVVGGHVKKLVVGPTCEIFIHDWFKSDKITRKFDENTGLNLLDL